MKDRHNHLKSLETMSVLALASIIFGLIFRQNSLLYMAASFLFIGLFLKALSARISQIWLRFALIIGEINSKILLSLIFFLFLTPISFLYRLAKGDVMNLKHTKSGSLWHERNHLYKPDDLDKVW